jgi:hypothetical protein
LGNTKIAQKAKRRAQPSAGTAAHPHYTFKAQSGIIQGYASCLVYNKLSNQSSFGYLVHCYYPLQFTFKPVDFRYPRFAMFGI